MLIEVYNSLGVAGINDHEIYLGLPSFVGRNMELLGFMNDRAWQRMQGWHNKFLSKASKEILIKSGAQAIPVYTMSVFLLPLNLCEELERIMNSFWWGKNHDLSKGIHWLCWIVCIRKKIQWRNGV